MAWQETSENKQILFSHFLKNCDETDFQMKSWSSQNVISWSSPSTNSSNYSECDSPLSSQSSQFAAIENDENCRVVAIHTPTNNKRIRNVRRSDKHYCAVCGDKPTGYHYDVLSCNGCKTFFRRTIINKRQFKCAKGGKCDFNKDFRCACRACRFQKCILVGMNENAIQFREKDDDNDMSMESTNEYFVVPAFKNFIKFEPDKLDSFKALSILVQRESFSQSIRKPGYPIVTNLNLSAVLRNPNIIGCNRIKDSNDDKAWRQEVYCENPIKFWMIADLFLSVEFAKTFSSFRKLTHKDQNILLGEIGGILQIISQSYYSLMAKSDSMVFPDGINALQLRLAKGISNYEEYYRTVYCKPVAMLRELDLNDSEYVFFKTLALFSGDSLEMSEEGRKIIASARCRTLNYLRNHLVHQYALATGVKKFGKIVTALTSFFDVSEKRRTYLEVCHLISKITLSPISKSIFLKQEE